MLLNTMVAGGVNSTAPRPTEAVAELALKMQQSVLRFNAQYNTSIRMRIGISTGPLISGVIGRTKFAYDLWGGAVNLATHLQAAGPPGSIEVDDATYERLEHAYYFSAPRTLELKNRSTVTVRSLAPCAPQPTTNRQMEERKGTTYASA